MNARDHLNRALSLLNTEAAITDEITQQFLTKTIYEVLGYMERNTDIFPLAPHGSLVRDFGEQMARGITEDEAYEEHEKRPLWTYLGKTWDSYWCKGHDGQNLHCVGRGEVQCVDGVLTNEVQVFHRKSGKRKGEFIDEQIGTITEPASTFDCLKMFVDELVEDERQETEAENS
jgi:hypothetical protein